MLAGAGCWNRMQQEPDAATTVEDLELMQRLDPERLTHGAEATTVPRYQGPFEILTTRHGAALHIGAAICNAASHESHHVQSQQARLSKASDEDSATSAARTATSSRAAPSAGSAAPVAASRATIRVGEHVDHS